MFKLREGYLSSADQTQIFFQVWEQPQAKGTVLICPGHGEHTESYERTVQAFKKDKWSFYAVDLRGHGRSDGKRGFANDFDEYCQDYFTFVNSVVNELRKENGPVVLFSHSMGGLVELKTLLDHPELSPTALVFSSPLLGVAVPVPEWKNKAAGFLGQWLPTVTLTNEITNEMVSRDPDVIRGYETDVLRHDRMSPGVYLSLLRTIEYVHARASDIKIPTLFQIAENDLVVSSPSAREFFEKIGTKKKKIIEYGEGATHEVFNDIIREQVCADLKKYLDSLLEEKK
jgi:alpha-beta hydrolase superfamily lysophospholipase